MSRCCFSCSAMLVAKYLLLLAALCASSFAFSRGPWLKSKVTHQTQKTLLVHQQFNIATSPFALHASSSAAAAEGGGGEGSEEESVARELFDELATTTKGGEIVVTLDTFKKWPDVSELVEAGAISQQVLDEAIEQVAADKEALDFDSFFALVAMLDEMAADATEDYLNDIEIVASDKGFGTISSRSSSSSSSGSSKIAAAEVLEEEDLAMLREVFDELASKKTGKMSIKAFKGWDDVAVMVQEGVVDANEIDTLIDKVKKGGEGGEGGGKPTTTTTKAGQLDFTEFLSLVQLIDESSKSSPRGEGEEEDFHDDDDPSPEELEAMSKEIFAELKSSKTGCVSVKKLRAWEGVKEVLDSGELSMASFESSLAKVGATKANSQLDFAQFCRLMDLLEDELVDDDDEGADDDDDNDDDDDDDAGDGEEGEEVVEEEGKVSAAVKVEEHKKEQAQEVSKGMRISSLASSAHSRVMKVIDDDEEDDISTRLGGGLGGRRQNRIKEEEEVDVDEDNSSLLEGEVLYLDDEDEEEEKEEEDDFTEEEAARIVFEELCGLSSRGSTNNHQQQPLTLPLASFLRWPDVEELLKCGALSQDSLAAAIERVGGDVGQELSFEQFYKLIIIVDEYVEQDKLPASFEGNDDIVFERKLTIDSKGDIDEVMKIFESSSSSSSSSASNGKTRKTKLQAAYEAHDVRMEEGNEEQDYNDDDDDEDEEEESEERKHMLLKQQIASSSSDDKTRLSKDVSFTYIKGEKRVVGEEALDALQRDALTKERRQVEDEEEVRQMFYELSQGKQHISVNTLRAWDELRDLYDSKLISESVVEQYIRRLNLKADGKINLQTFRRFFSMLDLVLLDDGSGQLSMDSGGGGGGYEEGG